MRSVIYRFSLYVAVNSFYHQKVERMSAVLWAWNGSSGFIVLRIETLLWQRVFLWMLWPTLCMFSSVSNVHSCLFIRRQPLTHKADLHVLLSFYFCAALNWNSAFFVLFSSLLFDMLRCIACFYAVNLFMVWWCSGTEPNKLTSLANVELFYF